MRFAALLTAAVLLVPPTVSAARAPAVYDPLVGQLVAQVDWQRVEGHILELTAFPTRYSYSPHCAAAADSLAAFFARQGLSVAFHDFSHQGVDMRNVVATQVGTTEPDSVFVICSHYDSISESPYVSAPGADDNASGTAAVMTAAELLAPLPLRYTVKYICFAGEEQGVVGSGIWAEDAHAAGLGVVGAMNADMIAYWSEGADFDLEIETNVASQWLAAAITDAADLYTDMPYVLHVDDGAWWGDHYSFWQVGWNAVNHEEAWDWYDPDFNPYYHSTDDTLDKLSPDFAVGSVRVLVAALAGLAQIDPAAVAAPPCGLAPLLTLAASPNPFNGRVLIEVGAPGRSVAALRIFDLRGRLARAADVPLTGGKGVLAWDGRDDAGRPLPAGAYLCLPADAPGAAPLKLMFVK